MPKIIVEVSPPDGAAGERTFSERIVTQHLQSGHYSAQLLERLVWAVADAEAAETGAETGSEAVAEASVAPVRGRPPAVSGLYLG